MASDSDSGRQISWLVVRHFVLRTNNRATTTLRAYSPGFDADLGCSPFASVPVSRCAGVSCGLLTRRV